jgi:hypothetical protein
LSVCDIPGTFEHPLSFTYYDANGTFCSDISADQTCDYRGTMSVETGNVYHNFEIQKDIQFWRLER